MNDVVIEELKALKQDAEPKEFVFSHARSGVNIDSIKTGWRNACEAAGLVNLRFHDHGTRLQQGLEPMAFMSGIFGIYSVMRR
jgi:hypothetical protein